MESLIENVLYTYDNASNATVNYAKILKIPISDRSLVETLQGHPDYPSMLAIYDTFDGLGAEVVAAKIEKQQLPQIVGPFIAQIQPVLGAQALFTVVKQVSPNSVIYLHPERGKWITESDESFHAKFTGVILIADASSVRPEKDYNRHVQTTQRGKIIASIAALLLPLFAIMKIATYAIHLGAHALWPSVYLVLSLFGTFVCSLLLWHEVDRHNPLLKQVCSGGKKVNCDAILQSKASSLFGVSWSIIGFTYFGGQLLTLLISDIPNRGVNSTLGYLTLLAAPYVFFSVYYQWRVAKQWCVLCLAVQAVLLAQAVAFFVGSHPLSPLLVDLEEVIRLALAFAISFAISSGGISLFRQAKEGRMHRNELARFKRNPALFNALLAKQKFVTEPTAGLGITLGNPNAAHKIIKVCNPYCGPCAKAHPILEEILKTNPDVQVQIIFTADDSDNDRKAPPVKHLMAIAEKGDAEMTKQALDDWYSAAKKDYAVFAAKYPMNGASKTKGHQLKKMKAWCEKTEISFTPTIFINGYQLPEVFAIADLKYILNA